MLSFPNISNEIMVLVASFVFILHGKSANSSTSFHQLKYYWGQYQGNLGFICTTKTRYIYFITIEKILYHLLIEHMRGWDTWRPVCPAAWGPTPAVAGIVNSKEVPSLRTWGRPQTPAFGLWRGAPGGLSSSSLTWWKARLGTQTPATCHWRIASRLYEFCHPCDSSWWTSSSWGYCFYGYHNLGD